MGIFLLNISTSEKVIACEPLSSICLFLNAMFEYERHIILMENVSVLTLCDLASPILLLVAVAVVVVEVVRIDMQARFDARDVPN